MRRTRLRTPPRRLLTTAMLTMTVGLSAFAVSAQDRAKKEKTAGQPFEVRLNVTVLDAAGRPVTDLRAEDFRVNEDGTPQQVKQLTRREGAPVFGIVADNSGSLRHLLDSVIDFGRLLVERSDPRSEIFVERFVGPDRIVLMQDFTTRRGALGRALEDMYVEGGQSAITDALYLAAEHMAGRRDEGQPPPRRALVLITDGEDRANAHTVEEVVARLRAADVQVFVLGLTKAVKLQVGSPEKAVAYLNRLALESGGALYLPDKKADLAPFAEQILAELNAPYTLSYAPANQKRDGSTRKLAVAVADAPDGRPRRVVVRSSYTAPKK